VLQDALLLGDFNADCSYVSSTEWAGVALHNDDRFTWLIGDEVDTTVANSDCAYDRWVGPGG